MLWHIGEILVRKKLISWEQLEDALKEQARTHSSLGDILVRRRWISKTLLYGALAKQLDMRFVDPARIHIHPRAAEALPGHIAVKYQLLPIDIRDNVLYLGIAHPQEPWPQAEIRKIAQVQKIETVLCLPEDIHAFLQKIYPYKKAPAPKFRAPIQSSGSFIQATP